MISTYQMFLHVFACPCAVTANSFVLCVL